jgi:hypothetical protein
MTKKLTAGQKARRAVTRRSQSTLVRKALTKRAAVLKARNWLGG